MRPDTPHLGRGEQERDGHDRTSALPRITPARVETRKLRVLCLEPEREVLPATALATTMCLEGRPDP
jgi:hypothetical protein